MHCYLYVRCKTPNCPSKLNLYYLGNQKEAVYGVRAAALNHAKLAATMIGLISRMSDTRAAQAQETQVPTF